MSRVQVTFCQHYADPLRNPTFGTGLAAPAGQRCVKRLRRSASPLDQEPGRTDVVYERAPGGAK
jgi:hypothetical protein